MIEDFAESYIGKDGRVYSFLDPRPFKVVVSPEIEEWWQKEKLKIPSPDTFWLGVAFLWLHGKGWKSNSD